MNFSVLAVAASLGIFSRKKKMPEPVDDDGDKAFIRCPACNQVLHSTIARCPYCAAFLEIKCPNCDRNTNRALKECPYCRSSLKGAK